MIVFDLRCLERGELFEGWFRSSAEYQEQSERGLVQCPFCQSSRVEKAPMAPGLPRRANRGPDRQATVSDLAELQAKILADSQWVGGDFPDKARAMHLGEAEPRPVHGHATLEEARSLAEEGVPILPLPCPVVPPGQVN
jgi:hypothetical protein